jgi:hypothetical protein
MWSLVQRYTIGAWRQALTRKLRRVQRDLALRKALATPPMALLDLPSAGAAAVGAGSGAAGGGAQLVGSGAGTETPSDVSVSSAGMPVLLAPDVVSESTAAAAAAAAAGRTSGSGGVTDAVLRRFRDSKHRVLFFDAEGLLVPAQPVTAAVAPKAGGGAKAGEASAEESDAADSTTSTASVSAARVVNPAALQALRDLACGSSGATSPTGAAASTVAPAASGAAAAATTVVVTSRMPRERLEALFGDEPFILVAENGAFVRWAPECVWECELPDPSPAWFAEVLPVFRYFADRTPGSVLDIKETSISWHYAGCDPQYGPYQARDLASTLAEFVSCLPVIVVTSAFNQYVEMRRPHANKALVVYNLLRRLNAYRDLHADPHAQQLQGLQQGLQGEAQLAHAGVEKTGTQLTVSGVAAASSFAPLLQHMTLPAVHLRKDLRRYLAARGNAAGAKSSGLALAATPAVSTGGPASAKAGPTGATAYTGAAGDARTTANDAPTTMTVSVAYAQQATAAVVPHLSPEAVMPRPASFRERASGAPGAAAAGAPQPGAPSASEIKSGGGRGTTADPAYAAVSAMYQRLFPQAPVDFVLCLLAPSDPKDADVFTLLQRMQADVLESAPSATPGGAAGAQGLVSLAGGEIAGADASSGSTDGCGRRVSVTTVATATDSTAGTDFKGPRIASPHATQVSQPHAFLKEVAGHGAPGAVTVGAAAAQAAVASVTGAGTASERGTPPPGATGGRPLSAASRQERVLGYGLRNLLASAVSPTAHHRQGSGQLARSLSHGQSGEAEAIINPTAVIALTPAGAAPHVPSPLFGGVATGIAAPGQPGAQMPPQTAEQEAILNAAGAPAAAAAAAPPRGVGAPALLAGVGAPQPGATTATAPAAGPPGALGQAVDAVADRKAGAAGSGSCNLAGGSGEDATLAGASEEAAAEAAEADALAQEEVAGLSLPPPRPLRAYAATRKPTVASMGSLANLAGLADSVVGPASAAGGGRAGASRGAEGSQQGAHTLLGGRGRVLTSVDLDTFELTGPSAGGGGGGGGSGDSGLPAAGPSAGASGAGHPTAAEHARSHSQRAAAAESKSSRSLHQLQTIAAGISAASDANKAVAAARRGGSGEGFSATPAPTRASGAGGGAHGYMPSPRIGERPYDLRGRPISFQRTDSDSSGITATSHSPAPPVRSAGVESALRPRQQQRQTTATGPERSSGGRGRASSGASDAFGLLHATTEEEAPARTGAAPQAAGSAPRTAAGASSALQPVQPAKTAMAGPGATAAPLAPVVSKAAAGREHAAADATSSLAGVEGGCGVCFIDCAVGRKEARRGARWYLSSAEAAASLLQLLVQAEQQPRA